MRFPFQSSLKNAAFPIFFAALFALTACGTSNDSPDGDTPSPGSSPVPKSHTFGPGKETDRPSLSNKAGNPGNAADLEWQVHPGDQIEIRPSALYRDHITAPEAKVDRIDNPVCIRTEAACVATEPTFQHQCSNQCHFCVQCQAFPPACFPWSCCDNVCSDVPTGSRCVRTETRCAQTENHWKEVTTYGQVGPAREEKSEAAPAETAQLASGLKLALSFANDDAATALKEACPLSMFHPKSEAKRILVTLGDVAGCPVAFGLHPGMEAHLVLVNEMNEPVHFPQGVQVKDWDGTVIEQARAEDYSPEISFAGTVTLYPIGTAPGAP